MATTKQSRYVIFAGPPKVTSCACYLALDGYSTILRSKAARFYSYADAKEFAEVSHVTLNNHTYIGLEDFTDS